MSAPDRVDREWRTSSYSTQDECVEVAIAEDFVLVRDSSNRTLPSIAFAPQQWARFTTSIRNGEFD